MVSAPLDSADKPAHRAVAVDGWQKGMNTFKSLVAGGLAGATAKTAVAPLERVKILFQVHNMPVSIWSSIKTIVHQEGLLALFKGNAAVCARIVPYSAIQYVTYDYFKALIYPADHRLVTGPERMLAGACAGVSAVVCTYPLDLVRVRLATQRPRLAADGVTQTFKYAGILDCLRQVHRNEGGFWAMYRGAWPTLIGVIPYAAINFSTYESLKAAALSMEQFCNENGELFVMSRLACGGLAGAFGQTVVYPLDTVRRRMQMDITEIRGPLHGEAVERHWIVDKGFRLQPTWVTLLFRIFKEEGMRGLFRGITINYIRVVPMVSISFTTYDMLKKLLNVPSTAGGGGHGGG